MTHCLFDLAPEFLERINISSESILIIRSIRIYGVLPRVDEIYDDILIVLAHYNKIDLLEQASVRFAYFTYFVDSDTTVYNFDKYPTKSANNI